MLPKKPLKRKQLKNLLLMFKLFTVGSSLGYTNWIVDIGNVEITCSKEEADFVLFTGGEDVDPSLYNQKAHDSVYFNRNRDNFEIDYFKYFAEKGVPMIGVCRGSQFLCVMAGGALVQDSTHPYLHNVTMFDGSVIQVNSTHHQQALLKDLPSDSYELLGWAENLSPYHFGPEKDYDFGNDYKEPEIIWYPKIKALGIQGHPESLDLNHVFVQTVKKLVIDKVFPCIAV